MQKAIIAFNAGSSSIKFSIFSKINSNILFYGGVEDMLRSPMIWIKDSVNKEVLNNKTIKSGHLGAIEFLINWIESLSNAIDIIAIGHRIVHGGRDFAKAVIIDKKILNQLKTLIPLAPLHQENNIKIIEIFSDLRPNLPQIACFDTSFHQTIEEEKRLFALPKKFSEEGIVRYGFHGISYEYIASILPKYAKENANKRVIIAHLGNGASMCAMKDLKSVATTMGFSVLDGLMMGTRCGSIDPGVILYLLEEKNMSAKEISKLLYEESGLKGVSGISHDIRDLIASNNLEAKKAINMFCDSAAKQLSGLLSAINGLDVLVFTAGIGENCPIIRKNICDKLSWLGIEIYDEANDSNQTKISTNKSKVEVYVLPTNEEKIIAQKIIEENDK
ncbi:MAG: acetate kinase [Rickettsiales bacterium]|jgi:acetate kinase